MSVSDKATAETTAHEDSNQVKEKSKQSMTEASTTLLNEVNDFNSKNPKADADIKTAYINTLTLDLQKENLLPPLSLEYLKASNLVTEKGLTKESLDSEVEKAKSSGDAMRFVMLDTIGKQYDVLKKGFNDGDGDKTLTIKDLEFARTKNSTEIKQPDLYQFNKPENIDKQISSDKERVELAKKINPNFNPDGYLTKGQTLYDLARQKLETMNSVLPEKDRKGVSNKEIFRECANIMNRSNDKKTFTALDPELASKDMQKSIPKDWNLLTSKTPLRLYTAEDLAILSGKSKPTENPIELTKEQQLEKQRQIDAENKLPQPLELPVKTDDSSKNPDVKESSFSNGVQTIIFTDNSMVLKDGSGRVTNMKDTTGREFSFSYSGDETVPQTMVVPDGAFTRKPGTNEWTNNKDKSVQKFDVVVNENSYSYHYEQGQTIGFNRDGSTFETIPYEKTRSSEVIKNPTNPNQVSKVITETGYEYEATYEGNDPQPVTLKKITDKETWTRDKSTGEWRLNDGKQGIKLKLSLTEKGYSYTYTDTGKTVTHNTDGSVTTTIRPQQK